MNAKLLDHGANPADRKAAVQAGLRRFHHRWLSRGLPDKLGVYFHPLEADDVPAFEAAIGRIRAEGYRIAETPDDFLAAPDPVAWLSFDDNFRSWHDARPLFDRLGVRCTFYTSTAVFRDQARDADLAAFFDIIEHRGERVTLTTGELKALHADGHTIGSHTHTHPVLSALPVSHALDEIRRSKEVLEALLGEPVPHFAYPYGMRRYFDDALIGPCRELGITTVARAIPAMLHAPQGPVELHRSGWRFDRSVDGNLADFAVDGRVFERLTGRSALG